jgi:hypothetical protein
MIAFKKADTTGKDYASLREMAREQAKAQNIELEDPVPTKV